MPIVSGVVTLSRESVSRFSTFAEQLSDPRIELGPICENRLPVVVTTETIRDDRSIWEKIAACEGVASLNIVFADFEHPVSDEDGSMPNGN